MGLFDKFKKKDDFQYNDVKNKVTYTCRHVMNKQRAIEYVSHDANGECGKVNIKLMKNYKVKLTKKFNMDFPIAGNSKPAIGFFIFYFLLSISSNLSFNL